MKPMGLYMMNFLVICVIAIALIRTLHGIMSSSVTIDLPGQGTIQGDYGITLWTNQTFMRFLGIPYAESPSRELRFKHAVKKLPWRHVLDATTYGRRCPVTTSLADLYPAELKQDLEDCLNLCVYTKNLTAQQPVMFYIYGGGFHNGSNIDHPPNFLLEKDIVLVVPNYRVGALGWLSTQNENMPGNAPVSDLYVALQWVQDYIYLFGGDPQQVTIFGQSAGTAMSGALLFSPKTPLEYFHRSIQQSGSIFSSWAINRKPIDQVIRVCRALDCGECELIDAMFHCLRNVSVLSILEATEQESFSPIVGDFYGILPRDVEELFAEFNRSIPLMTGFTKHDGSFVLASVYDGVKAAVGNFSYITVRQFVNTVLTMAKDDSGIANNLLSKMLFNKDLLYSNDHKEALPAYFDYYRYEIPNYDIGQQNVFKRFGACLFVYLRLRGFQYTIWCEFGNDHYPFEGGVHHSNDNIYLFPTHSLNDVDTEMAKKMVEIWTSFAINGNPSLKNVIEIYPMSSESGPYFHLNANITLDYDILQELSATLDDPENYKLNRPHIEF